MPDDQASQLAAHRIWARAQKRLDAAKGVAEKASVAQDLINGAHGLTLGTLQEELPDYLESEGVPTGWLPAAPATPTPPTPPPTPPRSQRLMLSSCEIINP